MSYGDRPSAEHCPQCGHLGAYEQSFCPVDHPVPSARREPTPTDYRSVFAHEAMRRTSRYMVQADAACVESAERDCYLAAAMSRGSRDQQGALFVQSLIEWVRS